MKFYKYIKSRDLTFFSFAFNQYSKIIGKRIKCIYFYKNIFPWITIREIVTCIVIAIKSLGLF